MLRQKTKLISTSKKTKLSETGDTFCNRLAHIFIEQVREEIIEEERNKIKKHG